jgi:hypothetical protein
MSKLSDEQAAMGSPMFEISVGPLDSIGSLYFHLGKPLALFNEAYARGQTPRVLWDLRDVQERHVNMAALVAFLAIAHRMRQFTGHRQAARLVWNEGVLSFWYDIGVFRTSDEFDLFDWQPHGVIGGFTPWKTNPNTKVLAFSYAAPPDSVSQGELESWKNLLRVDLAGKLLLRCGRLFETQRDDLAFPANLVDQVTNTTAELVVNTSLHGRTVAFVGLQRSRVGVTVAVCDCGDGFLASILRQRRRSILLTERTHIAAVFAGSLVNLKSMGLRRAIDEVVSNSGWIRISSGDADVRWKLPLWERATEFADLASQAKVTIPPVSDVLGSPVMGKADPERYREGGYRIWKHGFRGSRISFEIPVLHRRSET